MTGRILMCEPVHFRIDYEINPWMRRANAVDREVAGMQWGALYKVIAALGVEVELVLQAPEAPDMTFTANAGIVLGRRFIAARFRYPERQVEEPHFARWFEDRGYTVVTLDPQHHWEGEGDVLCLDGQAFAGFRFRTEAAALDELERALGQRLIRLELADPRYYHFDTCFCPLGDGTALYYPPAFTAEARARLDATVRHLIAVPDAEAARFACNAIRVGDVVVLNTGCEATEAAIARRGMRTIATPTSEFIKAGGSVKCLILTLDGFGRGGPDS